MTGKGRITTVDATYRVVTLMFCGGADPRQSAELRLPSFKGVLRFWWRALAWGRLGGNLDEIHKQEARLFGSAEGGQSRVVMRLKGTPRPHTVDVGSVLGSDGGKAPHGAKSRMIVGPGARYLGYGVMGAFGRSAGKLDRPCLRASFNFTVRMRCRGLTAQDTKPLKQALVALGTFGGMGAKSRKGYGSLVLGSLRVDGNADWRAPQSIDDLDKAIRSIHESVPGHRTGIRAEGIPFTVLSPITRHVLLTGNANHSPLELLDMVGREMVRFRAWGYNGRVLDRVPSERNFKGDHDLMKSGQRRTKHPERIAFGLPHNYGRWPDQQVGPADDALDRRASPLFIHIHLVNDRPVAVLSLLPARFLPRPTSSHPGAMPQIKVGGERVPQRSEDDLFQPIHQFLNRLTGSGELRGLSRQEPFKDVREVKLR